MDGAGLGRCSHSHQPSFSHGNHPTGEHPCLPLPWEGCLGPALALSISTEPAWSCQLLVVGYKSFKAANVFFFFFFLLFWVKKMDFFCNSLQCHWYGEMGADAVCALQTPPCAAKQKLAAFPCLPFAYSYFSHRLFFWESFVCAGTMPDDKERDLCSWGATASHRPIRGPPVLQPTGSL